jgi:transketolase
VSTRVVDVFTVKPLDVAEVLAAARQTGAVLTVEEGNVSNGLGTAVAEVLLESGAGGVRFRRHGIPDEHVPVGPPAALYAHYRLDADGVAAVAQELLR